jgi:hypothetical protein
MTRMPITRAIVTMLLALCWLPATLHCGLQAVGVLAEVDSCCHHDDASDKGQPCSVASCAEIETGRFQANTDDVKVPAPVWLADFAPLVLALELVTREGEPEAAVATAPPELLPTWQFERRTAPLSRAPSLRS